MSQWIGDFLTGNPNGISSGTVTNTSYTQTASYRYVTVRQAIDAVCLATNATWRINPTLTLDAATSGVLFVSTPTVMAMRGGDGSDPAIIGIKAIEFDAAGDVEDYATSVIVIARGGGSVEDLLPFSDETLCRAIAACTTPVVSAIGHEPDNPVCDLVADVRAATPTDAAKRVVPDATAELALVGELRHRSAQALRNWVVREQRTLAHLRSRPVLADPLRAVAERAEVVHRARAAVRRDINRLVAAESDRIGHLAARLATLGPAATLARGYAVVQTIDGSAAVLRSVADAPAGARLRIRLSDGAVGATSSGPTDGVP